jgi:nitronate monooxygenase
VADLHRPICDLLGCDYPVVLAGMGGVARSDLVAAVTLAGGFGFLGMVREPVALIRAEVTKVRERTDRDFGVNLIPAATDPTLLNAQIAECIALEVPVVCLFWDISIAAVRRLREAGIIVVCQVGSAGEAREAQKAGAHALITQGREAGGHVRGLTPRDVLLCEVLAAVEIPVLAAGGIVSGADLTAVLAQGADGAVIGTAFLATEESFAHDYHKQRIVEADADDTILTDIFHINWPIGALVRVLKNSVTSGAHGDPFADDRIVIGDDDGRPIHLFSTDSPLRSMTGKFEAMALYAGEAACRIIDIPSAAERLRTIVDEAAAALDRDVPVGCDEPPLEELSSPACWARDADEVYMGYASHSEITALLSALISAKRAGARLLLHTALETQHPVLRIDLLDRYRREADWRHRLTDLIHVQGGETEPLIDGCYQRAMKHTDLSGRLQILRDTQEPLLNACRAILPKIRDNALHAAITLLLDAESTMQSSQRFLI